MEQALEDALDAGRRVAAIVVPEAEPAVQQIDEIRAILDKAVELNLNAIILQVRTSCDAFSPSPYEP